ncbi:MAG: DUF1003 domain-containing protein [archaeon]|jgi:uncharacterized membrane protein
MENKNLIKPLEKDSRPFNKLNHPKLTRGEKAADWLAKWAGSWSFIGLFALFLFVWMVLNSILIIFGTWDLYPFILLNLCLSCVAALQAPIILMSQNRQSDVDRHRAEYDYVVNRKAEREIKQLQIDVLEMKQEVLKQSTKSQTQILRVEVKKLQEELNKIENKIK